MITIHWGDQIRSYDLVDIEEFKVVIPSPDTVTKLTVYSEDVQRVIDMVEGIPVIRRDQCVSWYGDHAKFIVSNLWCD